MKPVRRPRRSRVHASIVRACMALACVLVLAACASRDAAKPTEASLVVGKGAEAAPVTEPKPAPPEDESMVPVTARDAVRGSRLALVTLVVFSDFQCPFCGRLVPTLDRIRAEYGDDKVRVVFKNEPLSFHPQARLAAETGQAVLELAGVDAFWRYHDTVFRAQSTLSPETIRSTAIAAGVDERAFDQGLAAKRFAAKIDDDAALAQKVGANGTPTIFVNGTKLVGAQAFEKFKEAIEAELPKASAAIERGVAPAHVYSHLVAVNYKVQADDDDDDLMAAKKAAAEAKVVHKVPVTGAPARGPGTALVTIVEFSDFQCPYCKRAEETLTQLRRDYGDKLRIVWRDRPLSFHPRAEPAAELARAARAQKGDAGFWAMHDALFASQPKLEDGDFERVAKDAKLDVTKALTAVSTKAFRKAIDADGDLGDDLQANGTPNFFVNGRRLVGAQPYDTFKALIDEELAKAEALVKSGTARAGVYDTLLKDGQPVPQPEKKTIAAAPPGTPFRGAANAKIEIHEVGDFQCPFCARAENVMNELLATYPGQIKIVWRDKPLSFHPDAALAAEAAREAYVQKGPEGFEKMRKALFANGKKLGRADLDGHARAVGLDMTKFAQALDTHVHKAAIDAEDRVTTTAGVTGTPAFFVGPYYVSGAQPFAKFRRLVDLLGGSPVAVPKPTQPTQSPQPPQPPGPGLVVKDDVVGTGRAAVPGDKVKVHYVGRFTDGTEFDQSRKRGQPFTFELGAGRVIKGWDQGVVGMKVGGKRQLTIPPALAYGDRAISTIPANSTLVFDVELLAIE